MWSLGDATELQAMNYTAVFNIKALIGQNDARGFGLFGMLNDHSTSNFCAAKPTTPLVFGSEPESVTWR